jgi:hypothetical protein
VIFLVDIASGVVSSALALWKKENAKSLQIKSFDWNYLGNFAQTQLLSPPFIAVAGGLLVIPFAPEATQPALYALVSATIFAQSLVLTRDVFNKIRKLAALVIR